MKKLALQIAKEVKDRTRAGNGVKTEGGQEGPLKQLSSSYVKQREGLAKNGRLSSATSPGKSNLTQTGEMLDDIVGNVNATSNSITVSISFNSGENKKKAEYVSEDRPFMNLSDKELAKIQQETENVAYQEALKVIKSIK